MTSWNSIEDANNPTYTKALVRRAEAHEKLEHFEEAVTGKFISICFCFFLQIMYYEHALFAVHFC